MLEINQIRKKLRDDEFAYMYRLFQITHDKQARNILVKLAIPNPISYESIPPELGTKHKVMGILHKLEQMGLASSKMVKRPDGSYREYDITDNGRDLVSKHT